MTSRLLICMAIAFAGCGVRGKPEPPETPPELGRGQPTFKRATEEFAFPMVPDPNSTPQPKGASGRDAN